MNRTRGFVNLNRFKSGRALKRLKKVVVTREISREGKRREARDGARKP